MPDIDEYIAVQSYNRPLSKLVREDDLCPVNIYPISTLQLKRGLSHLQTPLHKCVSKEI